MTCMKIFVSAIKALFIIALLVIGFFFSVLSHLVTNQMAPSIGLEDPCQLSSKVCTKGNVNITLEKDTLTPLESSSITVNWPNSDAENIIISLQGLDMAMGSPVFQLHKTENQTYKGEILLPICTQNTMIWVGTINDGSHSVAISLKAQQ